MTAKIYRFNYVTDEYDLVAMFHDDGTVEGTSSMANRLRTAVDLIELHNEDPADWVQPITDRLLTNWDNGYYRIGWS